MYLVVADLASTSRQTDPLYSLLPFIRALLLMDFLTVPRGYLTNQSDDDSFLRRLNRRSMNDTIEKYLVRSQVRFRIVVWLGLCVSM